jgi:hypothetical protein
MRRHAKGGLKGRCRLKACPTGVKASPSSSRYHLSRGCVAVMFCLLSKPLPLVAAQ